MAEDYLYACQRAELLGELPPTEEEWAESLKSENYERSTEEDFENNATQILDQTDEGMTRVSGGLDELNTILNATQKKINKFKTACSSLGTILKVRVTSRNCTPDHKPLPGENTMTTEETTDEATITIEDGIQSPNSKNLNDGKTSAVCRTRDINDKVASHIDKLDSLITKAENAQYSMQHQTKQMKKIMK